MPSEPRSAGARNVARICVSGAAVLEEPRFQHVLELVRADAVAGS